MTLSSPAHLSREVSDYDPSDKPQHRILTNRLTICTRTAAHLLLALSRRKELSRGDLGPVWPSQAGSVDFFYLGGGGG